MKLTPSLRAKQKTESQEDLTKMSTSGSISYIGPRIEIYDQGRDFTFGADECKLQLMFELRDKFMVALAEDRDTTVYWPLDLSDKKSQQKVRDTILKGVEETFEALSELKNTREHKKTEDKNFDRDAFLEEMVDVFNYYFSALILAGFSAQDLFDMYLKKDKIIHNRLNTGY